MKKLREEMPMDVLVEKSISISEYLLGLECIKAAKTIMAYVDMPKEVKTDIIINTLLNMGKDVAVPVCVPASYELIASKILSLDELKSGHYGILEPKKEYLRPMAPDTFDVILVPGSAFDVYGNRIGHGKGYYDRFLSKVPQETLKIGLAFDYQILPRLPVEHYDIPVNCIITERGIIQAR
ncbi:MAG: 5-formyltetrahydrofolate cyclo-ligase [Clostridiales bacterium]|nr:5-formyltetrahydrofolate cyclo-ligase [Clostridiales bacterium]